MKSKLSVLLSGVDEFAERTSMAQQASEIIGVAGFKSRIQQHYKDIAGSEVFVMTAGVPRKPGHSREDLIQINAGQHIKLCERNRFDNRYAAYEYLARGERVVCLVSSARYWGLRLWSDTPADKERIKQELLAKKVK